MQHFVAVNIKKKIKRKIKKCYKRAVYTKCILSILIYNTTVAPHINMPVYKAIAVI